MNRLYKGNRMINNFRSVSVLLALVSMLAAGCSSDTGMLAPTPTALPLGGQATSTTASNTPGAASLPTPDKAHPTKITIALGYIPDVQFAPFYVALNKGYFADQGLDVTLKHGIVPDLIKLLGQGDEGVNFAVASGDEIIPARLNDIPVEYVMTWYRQYPVAAVSIVGKGPALKSPADLKGKVVGVPGPYGSTYTGLLALLKAGGLTLNDITLKSIGFTQIENLTNGQVDVAMVYAANEPVQLKSQGLDVTTLMVADYADLASNGLITNVQTFNDNPVLIARVIRATQQGIQDTMNDPAGAFQEALKQVPEAGGPNKDRQMKVLEETIKLMKPKSSDGTAQALGYIDPQVWANTQDFLYEAKLITKKGQVAEMFSNRFVVQPENQ
jgi:NitT/TauT family transport system substrate-binding protein